MFDRCWCVLWAGHVLGLWEESGEVTRTPESLVPWCGPAINVIGTFAGVGDGRSSRSASLRPKHFTLEGSSRKSLAE